MDILFDALPHDSVAAIWRGGPDAYGLTPERRISDGAGVPCRHCLANVNAGEPYLVLAWRPFSNLQPYAETGPIFLHADPCPRFAGNDLPAMLASDSYILRGYDAGERIVYGTGGVIARDLIGERARTLLSDAAIAAVHVRSARNNCCQCRIVRT